MLRVEVLIPIRDLTVGPAATLYSIFLKDMLQRRRGNLPLLPNADRDRIKYGLIDNQRPPTVIVHLKGGGTLDLPEVTPSTLALWLDPTTSASLAIGAPPPPAVLDLIAHLHRCVDELRGNDAARRAVAKALAAGLDKRLGHHLSDSELAVYFTLSTLAAPGIPRTPCVCKSCAIVFTARRARFCPGCRRNPPRATGLTDDAIVRGDRRHPTARIAIANGVLTKHGWMLRPGTPRRSGYERECAECDAAFISTDARRRYCAECASGTKRSQRGRARKRA